MTARSSSDSEPRQLLLDGEAKNAPSITYTDVTYDETQELLIRLQQENTLLQKSVHDLQNKLSYQTRTRQRLKRFFTHHHNTLLALPGILSSVLWFSMLLYFLIWYLTLPREADSNRFPKICKHFSLWPYISCIGAHKLSVFRGVCTTIALLIATSFLLLCISAWQLAAGRWMRLAACVCMLVSCGALVALSYESAEASPREHLVWTSVQIFAMGHTKLFDMVGNTLVRRGFGRVLGRGYKVKVLERSRWGKKVVTAFTIVPGVLALIGLYECPDAADVADPRGNCSKAVAMSSVCEWFLSVGWAVYILSVSYDLYCMGSVVEIYKNPARALGRTEEEDRLPLNGSRTSLGVVEDDGAFEAGPLEIVLPRVGV